MKMENTDKKIIQNREYKDRLSCGHWMGEREIARQMKKYGAVECPKCQKVVDVI